MNEKNEEGLSIGDFFKLVWSQKILALILVVAITLAGTIVLFYGYNALTAEYSVTYRMSFPQTENFLSEYAYPDGTVFYYRSLTSNDALNAVKAKDDRFRNIDNHEFNITYNYSIDNPESTFTITSKTSNFPSEEVARDFFVALANSPVDYFSEIEYDYHSPLSTYLAAKNDTVTNYDGLLGMLSTQLYSINSIYEELVSIYGNSFALTTTEGEATTLSVYANSVDAYYQTNTINLMQMAVRQDGIVKSESLKSNSAIIKADLERELTNAEITLQTLISSSQNFDGAETVKAQQDYVNALKTQIGDLEKYSTSQVNTAYMTNLDTVYDVLEGFTTDLEQITKQINVKVASVVFTSNTIIETDNLSLLVCIAIPFIVSLIVAIIACYLVAATKLKKTLSVESKEEVPEEKKD